MGRIVVGICAELRAIKIFISSFQIRFVLRIAKSEFYNVPHSSSKEFALDFVCVTNFLLLIRRRRWQRAFGVEEKNVHTRRYKGVRKGAEDEERPVPRAPCPGRPCQPRPRRSQKIKYLAFDLTAADWNDDWKRRCRWARLLVKLFVCTARVAC